MITNYSSNLRRDTLQNRRSVWQAITLAGVVASMAVGMPPETVRRSDAELAAAKDSLNRAKFYDRLRGTHDKRDLRAATPFEKMSPGNEMRMRYGDARVDFSKRLKPDGLFLDTEMERLLEKMRARRGVASGETRRDVSVGGEQVLAEPADGLGRTLLVTSFTNNSIEILPVRFLLIDVLCLVLNV
jgi:hypothetical protein